MTLSVETELEWEAAWWGDCRNTFGEEAKQITYAHRMGLVNEPTDGKWPVYDMKGKSVLDLGGGPVSMLLKCSNLGLAMVVDPCPYPVWVKTRYAFSNILLLQEPAETFRTSERFDECWIYNVLEHVMDPEAVMKTATLHAKVVRFFEWVDTPPSIGHPHTLHAGALRRWVGGIGAGYPENVNENGAVGAAYYGAFEQ